MKPLRQEIEEIEIMLRKANKRLNFWDRKGNDVMYLVIQERISILKHVLAILREDNFMSEKVDKRTKGDV